MSVLPVNSSIFPDWELLTSREVIVPVGIACLAIITTCAFRILSKSNEQDKENSIRLHSDRVTHKSAPSTASAPDVQQISEDNEVNSSLQEDLHKAILTEDLSTVKRLIDQGAKVNVETRVPYKHGSNNLCISPLMFNCIELNITPFSELLKRRALLHKSLFGNYLS